jgi:hypothetical protein
MLKPVKSLVTLTIIFSFFLNSTCAQLRLPVVNGVANDIKKVLEDYPNRFINLMGEIKMENSQSTDYFCNFNVNGAEESIITRYSAKKEICSWQSLMLTTENFEKAKQKFKTLFNQLNNLSVDIGSNKNVHLKGKYETPDEAMKFTSVSFSIESVKKLKIEISLQYEAPIEWKVKVLVYDKDREDDERGKTVEESR